MPILFLPTIQLYKIKLTCRLPPQWGLPELPSDAPQETPKPAGKKTCHDFSDLELRRSCLQYIANNSKSPTAETRSRPAVACCAKWPQSGGGVQFASQLLDIWKHVERWKQKYSLLPSFVLLPVIWGSVQCVGGDGAPNYWICTNWRQGWGGRGGRVGIGQIILWKFTKTRQNEFWAAKSWIMEPYGPDFEELMHCNGLLLLIVQLLPCLWFPSLSFQGIALLPSWAGKNVNKLSRTFKVVMTDYDDADDNYHNDGGTSERAPLSSL